MTRTAWRVAASIIAVATVVVVVNGVAGHFVIRNATEDAVSQADAVIVLGGEHDGRESYGLSAAQAAHASALVLSNPYSAADPVMSRMCSHAIGAIEVLCPRPDPSTTRGEAVMTSRLASERHWKSILIVSWRYHLPRTRLIFGQCLSGSGVAVTATAVPRAYELPMWFWQYIYFYQFAGIAKAVASGRC